MSAPVRVLVVEDSDTVRALLVAILRGGGLEVVGEARDGVEAVDLCRAQRPDVVTMDIHLPRLDGLSATRRIMAEVPTPVVIVSGSSGPGEVATSMEALRAGALTLLERPPPPGAPDFAARAAALVETVRAMSQVKVVRHRRPPRTRAAPEAAAVAVAASTGGPAALHRLLGGLPPDLPAALLVVQHMPAAFLEGLVTWLGAASPLPVQLAAAGEPVRPGVVYVAPGGLHLEVHEGPLLVLAEGPPLHGFRPAADRLFTSVARVYGARAVGVVLTGMGRDGCDGAAAIRAAGGRIVCQDRASAVVYGMPGAVAELGLADVVVPLDGVARQVTSWAGSGRKG